MVEQLRIDHVGHRGDGVSGTDGHAVYVPFALPGEHIEVEAISGHPDRRHLLRVIEPSPERIDPFCLHFGICGGCAIQHWREDRYRDWKRALVVEALTQAGIACEVGDLVDAHGDGRRRIVLHARSRPHDILKVGYMQAGSHDIVPIDRCPILAPGLNGALDAARALAEALVKTGKPLDIQITATDNGLDVDIRGSGALPPALTATLAGIATKYRLARLTRHGEPIVLLKPPTVSIGPAKVTLPPGSFLQATEAGENALAAQVLRHCEGAKHIADLFCGVGPFALRLAQRARVTALDAETAAVDALRRASQMTKGMKPVTAQPHDLFRRPLAPAELKAFDAVVFDPPRQGAKAQTEQLAASRVPLIVGVSCNPVTFARDAKLLIEAGYRLTDVTPIDQFKYSPHIELVARFFR